MKATDRIISSLIGCEIEYFVVAEEDDEETFPSPPLSTSDKQFTVKRGHIRSVYLESNNVPAYTVELEDGRCSTVLRFSSG